jgi:hypothetical protein
MDVRLMVSRYSSNILMPREATIVEEPGEILSYSREASDITRDYTGQ